MVKETRKRWLRKESSVHMLRPFLAAPLAGTLGVSWHWQVSININPWWDSPFGGYPQSLQDTVKLQSRAQCSLHAGRIIHSHKHTIELVKQKTCLLRKQRQLSVFFLWPEDPGPAPKVMAYGEQCRIHDLRRRRFSFRTRDQAWSLKSFCVAVLLKYKKRQRKLLT